MWTATALFAGNMLLIGLTALLLAIGAFLIHRAREDAMRGSDDMEGDRLTTYRKAYEAGLMDFTEYRRILDSLEQRRRGKAPTANPSEDRSASQGIEETSAAVPKGPSPETNGGAVSPDRHLTGLESPPAASHEPQAG